MAHRKSALRVTFLAVAVLIGEVWTRALLAGAQQASGDSEAVLERAQHLIADGQLEQARQELEDGAQRFPGEPFFNFLSVIDAQENHLAEAEKEFRETIRRSPRYEGAYLNLGHLYQEESAHDPKGFTAKAVDVYRALLQFDPQDIQANYQYSILKLRQHEFQDSLVHILKLPADDQQQPAALAILARCPAVPRTSPHFSPSELRKIGPIAARPLGVTFTTARWGQVLDGLVIFAASSRLGISIVEPLLLPQVRFCNSIRCMPLSV